MLKKKCQLSLAKKIGNIGALSIFICTAWLIAEPRLELNVTNSKGQPVKEVGVGIPFTVHIRMIDVEGSMQAPQIRGLSNFVQLHVRTSNRFNAMINGQTTSERTISYSVRAPQTGTYTLGPAELIYKGSQLNSNTVKVAVGEEEKVVDQQQKDHKPALFQVATDKKEAYAGEPVHLTVRFLYQPNVQLTSAPTSELHTQGWVVRSQTPPKMSAEMMDGTQYQCTEQTLEMYNYQPGPHSIPRFSVSCVVPIAKRSNIDFDFFDIGDFFGRSREQFDIHSNVLNIAIKPLPSHAQQIAGIAHITKTSLSLMSSSAQEGEGVVARLELEGSGDVANILAPPLQLPSSIHYYESKSEVQPHQAGQWKKVFEYIMQGTQPGVYEIPTQTFTFFDYLTGKYTVSRTQPVKLTIEPSSHQQTTSDEPMIDAAREKKGIIDILRPIYQGNYWSAQNYRAIPLALFILIILVLIILLVTSVVWRYSHQYRSLYMAGSKKKNAFKHARSQIAQYKKLRDVSKLYPIILTFFAERLGVHIQDVTHAMMEQTLREVGMQEEKIKAWLRDKDIYAELVYFNRQLSPDKALNLFDLLEQWMGEFEELL